MRTLILCTLALLAGHLAAQAYAVSAGSRTYSDLSGGTALTLGDEAISAEISPTGFAFPYFGRMYTSFKVCDNGFMILGGAGSVTSNIPCHSTNWPGPTIAPFWTNAKTGTGLAVPDADRIAWDFTAGVLTVEWRYLETDPNPSTTIWDPSALRMKAMLDQATGIIEFNYGDPTAPPGQVILICECVQPRDYSVSICDHGSTIIAGADMPYFVSSAGQVATYPAGRFIRFTPDASQITITTLSLPDANAGQPYSHTFTAIHGVGARTWSAVGLPAGFAMSAAGVLSAASPTAGNYNFTVQVTDSAANSDSKPFSITVHTAPLAFAAPNAGALANGLAGAPWTGVTFTASGGQQPYAWSIDTGALPPGLTLDTATGALSGVTGTAGDYGFSVRVTDALASTDARSFTIHVAAVGSGGTGLGGGSSGNGGGGCVTGSGTGILPLALLLALRRRRRMHGAR
ncbi:MAG: putative Ig domain-containing protein [Planctomycetes bacterium]|nr:putative Ig domain-containing protein [Planctomycetota bacterium]MCW8135397.1 putative Ig domain-containing protein [Planctomycetota bacterium]